MFIVMPHATSATFIASTAPKRSHRPVGARPASQRNIGADEKKAEAAPQRIAARRLPRARERRGASAKAAAAEATQEAATTLTWRGSKPQMKLRVYMARLLLRPPATPKTSEQPRTASIERLLDSVPYTSRAPPNTPPAARGCGRGRYGMRWYVPAAEARMATKMRHAPTSPYVRYAPSSSESALGSSTPCSSTAIDTPPPQPNR